MLLLPSPALCHLIPCAGWEPNAVGAMFDELMSSTPACVVALSINQDVPPVAAAASSDSFARSFSLQLELASSRIDGAASATAAANLLTCGARVHLPRQQPIVRHRRRRLDS